MNKFTRFFALFVSVALIVILVQMVVPASVFSSGDEEADGSVSGGERYLVKSENHPFAKLLNQRNHFDSGFTADLSSVEALLLRASGVQLEKVGLYYVLEPNFDENVGNRIEKAHKPALNATPSRVAFPSDQTPWGIEKMYNDVSIVSTSGGAGLKVAVLDTGVYRNHVDLYRRVADCKDFSSPRSPMINGKCVDKNGHGTHVSGTILADGGEDGLGIYGVAPAASLFAYKVCGNSGYCWSDDIAFAIRKAADNGANIISMSLGSNSESSLIRDAITYAVGKGVLVVAAAGNDGPAIGSIDYPGANANAIAVAAIDSSENVTNWSSRGVNDGDYVIEEREVEFAAPGLYVESTWKDGKYYTISGTSMATPHISGLAAKLWQGSASATRTYLQNLAKLHDIDAVGDDPASGFGLPQVPLF